MITRQTRPKVECPNGCGVRVYEGHLARHLRGCGLTLEQRRARAERAYWRRIAR